MLRSLFPFTFLLLLACPTDYFTQPAKYNLGQPFQLKVGQKCLLLPDRLEMGFSKVISDSRCPTGVECVWQGRADLLAWLRLQNSDTVFIKSGIFGYVDRADTLSHLHTDTLGYRITLRQLDPYPNANQPNDYSRYVAEFVVSKK